MQIVSYGPKRARCAWVIVILAAVLGPNAVAQQTYSLSYDWQPGRKISYSVYIVGKIQTTGLPDSDVKIRHDSIWEVAGGADTAADRYLVIESAKNFSGTDLDLRSFGVPPPNEDIQRSIDSYGRVFSVAHYQDGSRYHVLPLTFSPEPVTVGKSWTVKSNLHVPLAEREIETPVQVVYTLNKVLSHYKSQTNFCAMITFKGGYEYQAGDGSGVSGGWEGKAVFDLTEKVVVDYKIKDHRREWKTADGWTRTSALEFTAIEQKVIP